MTYSIWLLRGVPDRSAAKYLSAKAGAGCDHIEPVLPDEIARKRTDMTPDPELQDAGKQRPAGTAPAGGRLSRLQAFPLLALGWFCVGLGVIGILLPVMPTTVFLLIALWAFARSSPRFHKWLLDHPALGLYITDWTEHGVIPVRAKIVALALMAMSLAWLWLASGAPIFVNALVTAILTAVAAFILTRPGSARKRRR